jgi:hypothetical protein
MALKDLIADQGKIAEETIEKIVGPYVRFDIGAKKVVWLPQSGALSNEARVLLFLVAYAGWQYILDETYTPPTKPSDLENELGIPGGTLRPLLMKLKDSHLLKVSDGNYRVQLANIGAIESALAGAPLGKSERRPTKTAKVRPGREERNPGEKTPSKRDKPKPNQLKDLLTQWISDGFFDEPKGLGPLRDRYLEHAVIAKQTSLSGLMLDAVRQGLLTRVKANVGGKEIWVYKSKSKLPNAG